MANWKSKLKIRDLITEDDSSEGAVELARGISERLKKYEKIARVDRLIKYFNKINLSDADPLAEVNEGLNRLYDWADEDRVWVE